MERMYRYVRHVYDFSRRYFLFGRDLLLQKMTLQPNSRVLEMGCGTARNLIKLHRLHPTAQLFGLDASRSMLQTAEQKLSRRGVSAQLRHCLAEQLDHRQTFGLDQPFDAIIFSYSLSMMPTWPAALDAALDNLRAGGEIHIVDFWDQADLPRPLAAILQRWLALFHVHFQPELLVRLKELEAQKICRLQIEGIMRRYAYIARLRKSHEGL